MNLGSTIENYCANLQKINETYKMNKFFINKIVWIITIILVCVYPFRGLGSEKSRLIVTTDLGGSDPDDIQSMIHLLVCSDCIDIEGLISSQAWVNDPDKTPALQSIVDKFVPVLSNMLVHSSGFPTAEHLKSIVVRGQSLAHMDGVGDGMDSPGSELIVSSIIKEDDRPIWLVAWGGMNTIAQAIWKLHNTFDEDTFRHYLSKIRIYDILGQDDAGAYIAKTYPEILYIRNKEVYGWAPDDEWTRDNIQSKMPLGQYYPNRIWATEGDSPSFLYVLANGLNEPEHPDYGGWGGRFSLEKIKNIRGMDFIQRSGKDESVYDDYYMIGSAPEGVRTMKKWEDHIRNDFAARMAWSQESNYEDANHHPVVIVNGSKELSPICIDATPEETIRLSASGSYDPDNDNLVYSWYVYEEPSTGKVKIENTDSKDCVVKIPENSYGSVVHIILEVTDNGSPSLTSYRRIIITVKP